MATGRIGFALYKNVCCQTALQMQCKRCSGTICLGVGFYSDETIGPPITKRLCMITPPQTECDSHAHSIYTNTTRIPQTWEFNTKGQTLHPLDAAFSFAFAFQQIAWRAGVEIMQVVPFARTVVLSHCSPEILFLAHTRCYLGRVPCIYVL